MRLALAVLILVLFVAGCGTGRVARPITDGIADLNPFRKNSPAQIEAEQDPMKQAAMRMTRYGVSFIVIGVVFAAFTHFRTGWGVSLAAAGLLMIILAWTFEKPWAPWVGLSTIVAYASYKIWNRVNPKTETEHPLM